MSTEDSNKRTIEIDGHKFEVDMRSAKSIETYRVGDRVKVLTKDYSGYKTYPGAIVAIDGFKNLPTVVVAYLNGDYGRQGELEFVYLNSETKATEIIRMDDADLIPTRDTIIAEFGQAINKLRLEIAGLEEKREWFMRQFGMAFSEAPVAPDSEEG